LTSQPGASCHHLSLSVCLLFFFFKHPAPPAIYTLSLHDALPIYRVARDGRTSGAPAGAPPGAFGGVARAARAARAAPARAPADRDRKSTRLNSSHVSISYAVFC